MKFKGKHKVLHLRRNNIMHQYTLGTNCVEATLQEKDLGVLVHNELNMSQQCALAAKEVTSVLGCIRKSIADRSGMWSFTLLSSGEIHLACWVQCWGLFSLKNRRFGDFFQSSTLDGRE